jgi:hypothetical protein
MYTTRRVAIFRCFPNVCVNDKPFRLSLVVHFIHVETDNVRIVQSISDRQQDTQLPIVEADGAFNYYRAFKWLTFVRRHNNECFRSPTGLGSQCIHICIVEVQNELYRLVLFGDFVTSTSKCHK